MSTGISGRRVLIVEDEAGPRRQLCTGLLARGYETDQVETGISALDQIDAAQRRTAPYGWIIAGVDLPDIDGAKLLEVIQSRYPSLSVILLTSGESAPEVGPGVGVLRRPAALDELEALMATAAAPESVPTALPVAAPSSESAYVLVKLERRAPCAEIFRQLYFTDHVVYCDAVHGDYDLVLLFSAAAGSDLSKTIEQSVGAIECVESYRLIPLRKPRVSPAVAEFISQYDRQRATPSRGAHDAEEQVLAYALLEVDNVELESTFPTLYFTEGVVSCDATRGGIDLVLLLRAANFEQLRRLLRSRLRGTRGVLRARLLPIIEMFRM